MLCCPLKSYWNAFFLWVCVDLSEWMESEWVSGWVVFNTCNAVRAGVWSRGGEFHFLSVSQQYLYFIEIERQNLISIEKWFACNPIGWRNRKKTFLVYRDIVLRNWILIMETYFNGVLPPPPPPTQSLLGSDIQLPLVHCTLLTPTLKTNTVSSLLLTFFLNLRYHVIQFNVQLKTICDSIYEKNKTKREREGWKMIIRK